MKLTFFGGNSNLPPQPPQKNDKSFTDLDPLPQLLGDIGLGSVGLGGGGVDQLLGLLAQSGVKKRTRYLFVGNCFFLFVSFVSKSGEKNFFFLSFEQM